MAEDQDENEEELSSGEEAELEALFDNDEGNTKAAATGLKGILSNKKFLGGGVLLLLIAIGAGVYFMMSVAEEEPSQVEEEQAKEEQAKEEIKEEETIVIEKVNIYKLQPFFIPVRQNGKETGRFLSLSANLLLNNRVLFKELDKVLPIVRGKIYGILRKKSLSDLTLQRVNTEEVLKREIVTTSNSLLLSGSGIVTDVFFSSFMIK